MHLRDRGRVAHRGADHLAGRGGQRSLSLVLCAVTVAPSYGASSDERWWAWTIRPQSVELSDQVRGVLKIPRRLPSCVVVAYPLDEVLKALVVEAAVEDPLNLLLLLPIHDDRRWWGLDLTGERVACCVFQK